MFEDEQRQLALTCWQSRRRTTRLGSVSSDDAVGRLLLAILQSQRRFDCSKHVYIGLVPDEQLVHISGRRIASFQGLVTGCDVICTVETDMVETIRIETTRFRSDIYASWIRRLIVDKIRLVRPKTNWKEDLLNVKNTSDKQKQITVKNNQTLTACTQWSNYEKVNGEQCLQATAGLFCYTMT